MAEKIVSVRQAAWWPEEAYPLQLTFPEKWEIIECKMAGHDALTLSDEKIKAALSKPYGTKTISELAKEKKDAVIIFDDLTRPTQTYKIAPYVLEELHKAGLNEHHIMFMAAIGCHRPLTYEDFAKKLGRTVVETYPVYNHNVWDNFANLGVTSRGTPVKINAEVMSCDLKIGIGCIVPHGIAGFGGGAKMIMPGVSSIETICYNHDKIVGFPKRNPGIGQGMIKNNSARLDMEEVARMAGLDFKIDSIVNSRREIVDVFAGDFVEEHRAGAEFARKFYATEPFTDADIVVSNAYPQEDEAVKAVWAANASVKEGGDVVIICHTPEGQIPHYLSGDWGKVYGGKLRQKIEERNRVPKAKKVIVYNRYKKRADFGDFGIPEEVIWLKTWNEVLEVLNADFPEKAKVALYPCAALQCPPFPPDY